MIWKRKLQRLNPVVIILGVFLLIIYYEGYFSWIFKKKRHSYHEELIELEEIAALKKEVYRLNAMLRKYNVPEEEYNDGLLPVIYVITPTYARPQQKAELTRLLNMFSLVPSLHWIIIEDSASKTRLVANLLQSSGIPHTQLYTPTPNEMKLRPDDPNWYKPRGVLQRNIGIKWLHENIHVKTASGIVYFADDDNTYSMELFQEMRWTKKVSVWPVGLVGGVMVERPKVSKGQVTGWLTAWRPDRPFATDMAGFAVNLGLILQNRKASFSPTSKRGFMESDFLEILVEMKDLEPKALSCTKVYVWHTRTEKPDMKNELLLQKQGKSTNLGIEV